MSITAYKIVILTNTSNKNDNAHAASVANALKNAGAISIEEWPEIEVAARSGALDAHTPVIIIGVDSHGLKAINNLSTLFNSYKLLLAHEGLGNSLSLAILPERKIHQKAKIPSALTPSLCQQIATDVKTNILNIRAVRFTGDAPPSFPITKDYTRNVYAPHTLTRDYKALLSSQTLDKITAYKAKLDAGNISAGTFMTEQLRTTSFTKWPEITSPDQFIELILQTKKPQIFAESAVIGDGSDWNQEELSILGDISFVVPVTIYDNGVHRGPDIKPHTAPFNGNLLFVPGALLNPGKARITPDMQEIINKDGSLNQEAFYQLYVRRMLPTMIYASQKVGNPGAIITIPGIGCGNFAGKFQGQLEPIIKQIIGRMLKEYGRQLSNIKAVIYDPNDRPDLDEIESISGIALITKAGQFGKHNSQLKMPGEYGEQFSHCEFFSIVAWDHVSWPGNDYYVGLRQTDDGVKAAATNLCAVMTGVLGRYDPVAHQYTTPNGKTWVQLISSTSITLAIQDKIYVANPDGTIAQLSSSGSKYSSFSQLLEKQPKSAAGPHL